MSAEFMAKRIAEKLNGAVIRNAVVFNDGESFGFQVVSKKKGGERGQHDVLTVWVECDAEGNGPGWLSIDDE